MLSPQCLAAGRFTARHDLKCVHYPLLDCSRPLPCHAQLWDRMPLALPPISRRASMFPEAIFDATLTFCPTKYEGRRSSPAPLNTDSWLARSVLQKALRRGMTDLALSAAAQLHLLDRRTLWRRLIVTALEDLGPQEFGTIAAVVCAARNSGWRTRSGRLANNRGANLACMRRHAQSSCE